MAFGGGAEIAAHLSDRSAVFVSGGFSRTTLDTTLYADDFFIPVPVVLTGQGASVSGGGRLYFQPLAARLRPFVSVSAGFSRVMVSGRAFGFDLPRTDPANVVGVSPAVGVDMGINDRVFVRLGTSLNVSFAEGEMEPGLGVGAGLGFRLP